LWLLGLFSLVSASLVWPGFGLLVLVLVFLLGWKTFGFIIRE
jgi:hypothetical protein